LFGITLDPVRRSKSSAMSSPALPGRVITMCAVRRRDPCGDFERLVHVHLNEEGE